jgi:hypothetical protein
MDMELKAFEDELPNLFLRKDGVLITVIMTQLALILAL